MSKYQISINRLADFSASTDAGKKRIIREQKKPNERKISWYQLSKSRIRKSMEKRGNLDPVFDGIKTLESRKPSTKWRINDKKVSIEALRRFVNIKLPSALKKFDYSVLKPKFKSLALKEVDIIVAPDVVIRGKFMGQSIVGGIKIHISKRKPFDLTKAQYVSSVICKYLKEVVAEKDDIVLPELCFCLEVFGERLVPAPEKYEEILSKVKSLCDEVKLLWQLSN